MVQNIQTQWILKKTPENKDLHKKVDFRSVRQ